MKTDKQIINYLYEKNLYWPFIWRCIIWNEKCGLDKFNAKSLENNLKESLFTRGFQWSSFHEFSKWRDINEQYRKWYNE